MSRTTLHLVLLASVCSDASCALPPELRARRVWALDPKRAGQWFRPVWIFDTRRLSVVLLWPFDSSQESLEDRYGFQAFLCRGVLRVSALELGVDANTISAVIARAAHLGFADDDGASHYVKYMWRRAADSTDTFELCEDRLHPEEHPKCKEAVGSLNQCVTDAELRTMSRKLVTEPRWPAPRSLYTTEVMEASRRSHAVGSFELRESCEMLGGEGRQLVLWGLAIVHKAIRRAKMSVEQDAGNPLMRWSRKLLNVGAGDGVSHDPLWPLVALNFTGVWVEADPRRHAALRENLPSGQQIVTEPMTPVSVREILERHAVSVSATAMLDVLKVDVDSYDCDIVQAILSEGFRPKLVVVEVNWAIPPPLRYARHYTADLGAAWETGAHDKPYGLVPPYGCSLSYSVHMMRGFDYDLLLVEGQDAMFVHSQVGRWIMNDSAPLGVSTQKTLDCFATPPLDEFEVFRRQQIFQLHMPVEWVREWFYAVPVDTALQRVWSNISLWARQYDLQHTRFTLRI